MDLSYSVLKAFDGQNAIDLLETRRQNKEPLPDLMFIDVNMPRMNGFEFLKEFSHLKQIHTEYQAIYPVCMLSSSDAERDKTKAANLGATIFFNKPDRIANTKEI